ncbi:hypothetical protein TYRP_003128, partial [Tyrophagus putrescentiae]
SCWSSGGGGGGGGGGGSGGHNGRTVGNVRGALPVHGTARLDHQRRQVVLALAGLRGGLLLEAPVKAGIRTAGGRGEGEGVHRRGEVADAHLGVAERIHFGTLKRAAVHQRAALLPHGADDLGHHGAEGVFAGGVRFRLGPHAVGVAGVVAAPLSVVGDIGGGRGGWKVGPSWARQGGSNSASFSMQVRLRPSPRFTVSRPLSGTGAQCTSRKKKKKKNRGKKRHRSWKTSSVETIIFWRRCSEGQSSAAVGIRPFRQPRKLLWTLLGVVDFGDLQRVEAVAGRRCAANLQVLVGDEAHQVEGVGEIEAEGRGGRLGGSTDDQLLIIVAVSATSVAVVVGSAGDDGHHRVDRGTA